MSGRRSAGENDANLPAHLANPGSRLSGPGGPRLSPRRLVLLSSSGLEPTTLKPIGKPKLALPKPPPVPKAKALWAYTASNADELTFKEGDMITIMRKFNDGWCEGELNGKKGVFPSNYVTDLAPPEDDEEELPPPVLPIARPRAQALFAYQAQNNDELSLQPSQFITVLEKMSDGWWRGELDDGKMGMFPHNYVKELQLVRAQFTYMGRKEDELSFEEGDVLAVISSQGKFSTGELRGRVGSFPSNLVIRLLPNAIVKV